MSAETFPYDVFLSHSAKDKAVVRPVAERLRQDGLKVWSDEWECPSPAGGGEIGSKPPSLTWFAPNLAARPACKERGRELLPGRV